MFENIKYKNKRIIILIVFLLLFFATYKKLYKHTFNTVKTYTNLKSKRLDSVQLKTNIVLLKQELESINRVIGNSPNNDLIQQNILNFSSKAADSLKFNIVSLSKQHLFKINDVKIYSNFLEIEGKYNNLLKTIHTFEKDFPDSKINSVNLFTKKNQRTRKNKLYAKILFQNFKKVQ